MATINTNNYSIGGVDLYFNASPAHASLLATDTGATWQTGMGGAFRTDANSLGNIVTAEVAPDVTYIDHFIADCGKQKKDKTSAQLVTLTIPFTFDEMNENNLQKFFLASSLGSNKLAPLENPLVEGSAQMAFRTDVGQDMVYFIPRCTIRPDGNLAINAEDWWSGPMVLDVLFYDTGSWASKPYGMVLASTIDCS